MLGIARCAAARLRQLLIAIMLLMFVRVAAEATEGRRVALVIGNSAYQHTPVLLNPKNDAYDIAEVLSKLGFEVMVGTDLDKSGMDRTIRNFAERLSGASLGVFFYAGHGLQIDQQNYLVPVDARLGSASSTDFEMVRLDLIQRAMERESRANILFLDACRDNPLARNLARVLGTRSTGIGRGLAAVESGEGTLIAFSTQPGNVAQDGDGRNSPFAAAVVKHLGIPGDDISAVLINVRNDVMAATGRRQVPWDHSALTARVYFAARPVASPAAPTFEQQAELALWERVKNATDPALLQSYLDNYPNGPFAAAARAIADTLRRDMETSAAIAEQDRLRMQQQQEDDAAFDIAVRLNQPAGFRLYLDQRPNGRNRDEAQRRLASLEREAREIAEATAWERARTTNTLLAYQSYLSEYPSGRQSAAAKVIVDRLLDIASRTSRLRDIRSPEQLRQMANEARDTEFHERIEARLDDVERSDKSAWVSAESARTRAAYQAYLSEWAEGDYRQNARSRLATIDTSAAEWQRIKGTQDEALLEAFLKRDYIADFESAALAELVALKRARQKPLPPGISVLTAEEMARLIDGRTLRLVLSKTSISFSRESRPPGKIKLRSTYLQSVTKQRFAAEGGFTAEAVIDAHRLSIGGIGGVQESRVDKTGSLFLLQILGTDRTENDLASVDRLYTTMQIVKDSQGYVCIGTQWTFLLGNAPVPFEERCQLE